CIGIDDFDAKRDFDRLRAAGINVRSGPDDTLFVRSPGGYDLEISDTAYTGTCESCPPTPVDTAGPPHGKTPALRGRTINHFDMGGESSAAAADAFYTKLFTLSREAQRPGPLHMWFDHMGWIYYFSVGGGPNSRPVTSHVCVGVDGHRKEVDQDPSELKKIE